MKNTHIIYCYGTLRPFTGETYEVPGRMYDLGSFPGVKLGGDSVVTCEKIVVDDEKLESLDRYEGYYEDNHESSLYLRKEYEDGFIYEYNHDVDESRRIEDGVWKGRGW